MRFVGFALVVMLAACGSDDSGEAPVTPCEPPARVIGERCLEPGVKDNGCPAGTMGDDCLAAGVPAELCGEGFEADGNGGCLAVLPADPCPPGTMAVPGDISCRSPQPCGSGKWGDIPIDGSTEHVDASFAGVSNGSASQPWTTIAEAIAAVAPGGIVAVAEGTYTEAIDLVFKPVTLWGVCPEKVELRPAANEYSTILVQVSDNSTIRGVSITGAATAIALTDAENLTIEGVWIHDTAGRGVDASNTAGPASFSLRDVLIDNTVEMGVFAYGAPVEVRSCVVRATAGINGAAAGITTFSGDDGTPADLIVDRCALYDNGGHGIFARGAGAAISNSFVSNTLPDASGTLGRGIGIQRVATTMASATISNTVVTTSRDAGIFIGGSTGTLSAVTVRDTQPHEADGLRGYGVIFTDDAVNGLRNAGSLEHGLVERSHGGGVVVFNGDVAIAGVAVRDTQPELASGWDGRGIGFQHGSAGGRATGSVTDCAIERNHAYGVTASGSDLAVIGTAIRDVYPNPGDQQYGRGIHVNRNFETAEASNVSVLQSLVERCHDSGVVIISSNAILDAVAIDGVMPEAASGLFGDGIALASNEGYLASASIGNSRSANSARAGLAGFGATATLANSELSCNQVDLVLQDFLGPSALTDGGGNRCGCPAEPRCRAQSTDLDPPKAAEAF